VIASFLTWLPERFAQFRIDVVVEQDCEAADTIAALASHGLPVRVLTVPRGYRTPGRQSLQGARQPLRAPAAHRRGRGARRRVGPAHGRRHGHRT
jgi:hypothetical protein